MQLGHEIVSGDNRQKKLETWKSILSQHPNAILTCFRGGQRSQITQAWLRQEGFDRPLIQGGYKAVRQAILDQIKAFSETHSFLLISGPTGAGKTPFLSQVSKFRPSINLEYYAEHRGSAFGGFGRPQPSQAIFENRLGWNLFKVDRELGETQLPLVMEDESRLIGRCVIPEPFFSKLRASPIIWLDTSIEDRVQNTFDEYVAKENVSEELFARYKTALGNIQRRLGGKRYQEVLAILDECESDWKSRGELEKNKEWIHELLVHYYDPLYFGSLDKRNPTIAFKGTYPEALAFLRGQNKIPSAQAVSKKANPT